MTRWQQAWNATAGVLLAVSGCSRDAELCDADKLQAKALEGVQACQAKGHSWETCPERQRILDELKEELGRCSP